MARAITVSYNIVIMLFCLASIPTHAERLFSSRLDHHAGWSVYSMAVSDLDDDGHMGLVTVDSTEDGS